MTTYSKLNPFSIARVAPSYVLPPSHRQALDDLKRAMAELEQAYGLYWHLRREEKRAA